MSLNTDGSEDGELKVKGIEDFVVGDWRLPVMLAGEAEAAAAMPLSISSRRDKAKARREAMTFEKAALLSSMIEEEAEEDDWIEIEEIEAQLEHEKRRPRATRKENWQYFVSGLPVEDFIPMVIEGEGRTQAAKGKFHNHYFTATEARDGVANAFETDAEVSGSEAEPGRQRMMKMRK